MEIITNLPIGRLEVDAANPKVAHVFDPKNNFLMLNQIVYWGKLYGKEGQLTQGFTYSCSVDESMINEMTTIQTIFVRKGILIFSVKNGDILWD